MAGAIPQSFIDDLLSRADIVDVIGRRVPLKKAGREFQACCPFHDEKTPSFTVSPSKQFYHCFGCGAHGSAIGFIMEYDRLSFPDAIEELATSLGLEVPREVRFEQGPDRRPLYDRLEQAARFYEQQLRHHAAAGRAVSYLRERGVSGEIAARYRIGFAPPGWQNVLDALGTDSDSTRQLLEAGLVNDQDGRRFDRLRDRIVFPIRDARGRIVGFGGRVLGDGKPKYLNSPETPVFHKGRELYGLFEARQAEAHPRRLLVVEGYLDVVALAQFGISHAVATLGTATTSEHLEKLYRATDEVVFCFDGDRAGRDAAWKALNTALPLMRDGRQARFLFLPDGEDPDSLVRKVGAEALQARVAAAQPLSEFLLGRLEADIDMSSLDGRARLGEQARPLIERLPAGVFRDMMAQTLRERIGLTEPVVERRPSPKRGSVRAPVSGPGRRPPATPTITPMRRAIALLVQNPELAQIGDLPAGWEDYESPGTQLLIDLRSLLAERPELHSAALVEHWEDAETRRHLARLAVLDIGVVDADREAQFRGCLQSLVQEQRRRDREALLEESQKRALNESEKQILRDLYAKPGGGPDDSHE